MMFTDSPLSSRLTEEELLAGKLISLNPKTFQQQPKLSPVTCVCQWISVSSKLYGKLDIEAIFVTPMGHVIIILSKLPSGYTHEGILSEFRMWSHDTLDCLSEKFSFDTQGQSFTVADLLARHGHITFFDVLMLNKAIDNCLSNGDYSLFFLEDRRK